MDKNNSTNTTFDDSPKVPPHAGAIATSVVMESKLDEGLQRMNTLRNSLSVPKPDLIYALCGDFVAGSAAAFVVSPFASVMDTAITQNALGTMPLTSSLRHSMKQLGASYVKTPQFRWLWFVYGSTYATANMAATLCDHYDTNPLVPVLAASTVTNTTACIAKDRAFAMMFGSGPPRPVPLATYGAWLLRDAISMACVFSIPPLIAERISAATDLGDSVAGRLAQLTGPVLAQVPCTGLHLLGLDYYNRRRATAAERLRFLSAEYGKTLAARTVRGLVPYVAGALVNKEMRAASRAWATKQEELAEHAWAR